MVNPIFEIVVIDPLQISSLFETSSVGVLHLLAVTETVLHLPEILVADTLVVALEILGNRSVGVLGLFAVIPHLSAISVARIFEICSASSAGVLDLPAPIEIALYSFAILVVGSLADILETLESPFVGVLHLLAVIPHPSAICNASSVGVPHLLASIEIALHPSAILVAGSLETRVLFGTEVGYSPF